jgi:hypothetical protein
MDTQAQSIINRARSSLEVAITCQEARADAVQDPDGNALHCLPDGSVVLIRHDTCGAEAFPTITAAYEALEIIHAEKLATLILSEIPPLQAAMQSLIDAAERLCPGLLAAQVARAALAKAQGTGLPSSS